MQETVILERNGVQLVRTAAQQRDRLFSYAVVFTTEGLAEEVRNVFPINGGVAHAAKCLRVMREPVGGR